MSEKNKYEENMATGVGQEGTMGQREEDGMKNMRINGEINDAAIPSWKESAQKYTPETIWTHANIQAFSANWQSRLFQVATHPLYKNDFFFSSFYFIPLSDHVS